jgi:hypothetical protein
MECNGPMQARLRLQLRLLRHLPRMQAMPPLPPLQLQHQVAAQVL